MWGEHGIWWQGKEDKWMGAGMQLEFCLSSRISALLDGVRIKLDQNAPNLLC